MLAALRCVSDVVAEGLPVPDFPSDCCGSRSPPRHVSMTFLKNLIAYSVVQMGLPQDLARWAGDCSSVVRSSCVRNVLWLVGAGLHGLLGGALVG